MDESIGQALRAARLKKKLTIEEVSRATKMRDARINDLERDDYSRFPNLAYARNFLILYAKFVGVDISKYPTVEVGSPIGLSDYQYLRTNPQEKAAPRARPEPAGPPEKPRWLIVFFVFLIMLAVGALVGWGIMNFRRLGPVEKLATKDGQALATPTPSATPLPALVPSPSPLPTPLAMPSPTADSSVVPEGVSAVPAQPVEPLVSPSPEPEVRRAEPLVTGSSDAALLAETAKAAASPATFPPAGAVREIQVRAAKKIKVRIVHDNPSASSDYYGYMNPAMTPRTFRGKYFWIKTTEPDALQVTINGQAAAGPESGVEIVKSPGL